MNKITVIGGGTMGNGIAHVAAMSGLEVHLIDLNQQVLDRAMATIDKNLARMVTKEKITADEHKATFGRIHPGNDLKKAAAISDLIIEAVNENLDLKIKIFKEIDSVAPEHAILASNTSSISITKLATATSRPERVVGMHFFNPVPVMKLVEIIRGFSTSTEVYQAIKELTVAMGKEPVEVQDYPGFVSNRVLMPMINEAIYCVYEGVASAEDVDTVMKLGMAHPMGPLRLADFIGLDVCLSIMNVLYDGFKDSKYRPCPLLVKMVDAGQLGDKSGQGFYSYNK
ncbi:MAG TPA: 3-hydroxybutyryl-CoA dehydrogenase [Bacteroidetes bacterium]|nr:3-hydroxybutyryl-CoA dehydrogenase [Bacteroidota bacterium]